MEQYFNSSDHQSQDSVSIQPSGPHRRRRQNNTNKEDKIFICTCKKRYISYVSWYAHFKSKVHHKETQQERQNLKKQMLEINKTINKKPDEEQIEIVKVQNIPTFNEECNHKISADEIYSQICAAWKLLNPTLHLEDVIFNRFTDTVQGQVYSLDDITRLRKEMLSKEVTNLIDFYGLQHLQNSVSQCKEFNDCQITDAKKHRKKVLNFTWDLLKYFRPVFAAKLKIIIYTICHHIYNGVQIDHSPSINSFKNGQWSKYTFIEPFLQKYHKFWIKNTIANIE